MTQIYERSEEMMLIGYCRVSTKQQNLQAQISLLEHYGVKSQNIFAEKYTGKTTKRPKFKAMLKQLRPNDKIIIVRLDRFARNLRQALNAIYDIRTRQCSLKVLFPFPMNVIKSVHGSYKTVNEDKVDMLLLFAQWERKAILWRTEQGREFNKKHKKGYRIGRYRRKDSKYHNTYKRIFEYSKTHTIKDTAHHFLNIHNGKSNGKHISQRTVCNIKSMFDNPRHYKVGLEKKRLRYRLNKNIKNVR